MAIKALRESARVIRIERHRLTQKPVSSNSRRPSPLLAWPGQLMTVGDICCSSPRQSRVLSRRARGNDAKSTLIASAAAGGKSPNMAHGGCASGASSYH